jgi:hypothetical protein
MTEIDRPFEITPKFAVLWGCLGVPVGFLIFRYYDGAVYEQILLTIIVALFAAFCLYGPIVLARQVGASGERGWFVLRIAVCVVLLEVLLRVLHSSLLTSTH